MGHNLPKKGNVCLYHSRNITLTINMLGFPEKSIFKKLLNSVFQFSKYCVSNGAIAEYLPNKRSIYFISFETSFPIIGILNILSITNFSFNPIKTTPYII